MNMCWRSVLLLVLAASTTAHTADDRFKQIRDQIKQALLDTHTPSLAVAVAVDGKVIWEEAFGWADRENQVPATIHTMYSLASISKPITATGLMTLVEKGLLDLDQPANDYLEDSPIVAHVGSASDATLRNLANHTSGLPLHYQFFYEDEPYRKPDMRESIRRYGHLHAAPGERYQYANFGYGIIDYIIQRTAKQSYADFMRNAVFVPLGMNHSAVNLPAELKSFQAVRYGPQQQPLPFYDFDHPGASAVYSSVHDLIRFGLFHLKQRNDQQKAILRDITIDRMHAPTATINGQLGYGVGWFHNADEFGVKTVSHTGGMGGVRTRLVLVPDKNIAVATLCNFSTSLPLRVSEDLLAELIPEYREHLRQHRIDSSSTPGSAAEPPFQPTPELLGNWKGHVHTYAGKRAVKLWIKSSGDIHIKIDNQLTMLLNQVRFDDGELRGVFASNVGTNDANRRPYHVHLRAKLRGTDLNGSLATRSLPGSRPGNALSYWIELEKDDGHTSLFDGKSLKGWRIVTPFDFLNHGKVSVDQGTLLLDAGQPATGIAWMGELPRIDYELQLDAQRVAGDDFFCGLTFPVGPDYCTLILGGWGGGVTGLSNVNGNSAVENETTAFSEFENGRWYHIRLRVTSDKIQAWVDKDQIVDLETKDKKLSIWWEQEPVRPLGIANWYTKTALRNLSLQRVVTATP